VTFNIGNSSGQTFTVSVIVGGYYTGSNSVTVNVAKPLNDFVTGGGHIILENSVGLKAGDAGTRNNFGFNVKYNKSNKNLQGNVNVIFRRTESDGLHTYQVKGNVMSSLSVNPTSELTGSAFYNGKASLSDITNPLSPVSLGGNAIVNMEIIDNGEPGTNDAIAITVWNSSNALWFSSKWNGTTTVTQNLAGGNLSVRGGAYGFVNSDLSERNEPTKDALNSNNLTVELAPNPVSDIVNLQLNGWENDGTVKVYLTDMLMRTHQVWQISLDNGQASMNLNIVNQPAGAYLINIQGENTKRIMTKKIVKTGN
jgi:hypothetical protein